MLRQVLDEACCMYVLCIGVQEDMFIWFTEVFTLELLSLLSGGVQTETCDTDADDTVLTGQDEH